MLSLYPPSLVWGLAEDVNSSSFCFYSLSLLRGQDRM